MKLPRYHGIVNMLDDKCFYHSNQSDEKPRDHGILGN